MSRYSQLKNCWVLTEKYNLSRLEKNIEEYVPPVTLSLDDWSEYVSSGNNVILGSGGVIPGGTVRTSFGGSGAVYKGVVSKYGMYNK